VKLTASGYPQGQRSVLAKQEMPPTHQVS